MIQSLVAVRSVDDLNAMMQVIVATFISYLAQLSRRFSLPVIEDAGGGIPPGRWYVFNGLLAKVIAKEVIFHRKTRVLCLYERNYPIIA